MQKLSAEIQKSEGVFCREVGRGERQKEIKLGRTEM